MGFRVGPFVLCKNGCWRQRRRNTNVGPKKFFPPIIPPPHLSSQNDQHHMGIILSHRCWVDPPPPARQVGHPRPEPPLPSRRPRTGRGLGKWASVSPPPPQSNFLPALGSAKCRHPGKCLIVTSPFPRAELDTNRPFDPKKDESDRQRGRFAPRGQCPKVWEKPVLSDAVPLGCAQRLSFRSVVLLKRGYSECSAFSLTSDDWGRNSDAFLVVGGGDVQCGLQSWV